MEQEESLRKAISYCIQYYDNNEATNRIMEFIKDDRALQTQINAFNIK